MVAQAHSQSHGELPRYQQVAAQLVEDIESGLSPVGSLLMTEFELCEHFSVSRYTVREALRLLFEAGLVSRRRGAGTILIAAKRPPIFNHCLESIDDIIEYARETRLEFGSIEKETIADDIAEQFSLSTDDPWIKAVGIRYKDLDPRPVCQMTVYIDTRLEGIQKTLNQPPRALAEIIEDDFGVSIERIEQTIEALSLTAEDAKTLKADAGGAALRIIRRYFDSEQSIVQVSVSLYPAKRVSVSMAFDRGQTRAD
jgi:DNA-binding GntR family transcriptional regulator